jgi:hypothetical protein
MAQTHLTRRSKQKNKRRRHHIIIINIKGWAIWPVPSPELQLLSHKHQGLGHLAHSVSRVTAALPSVPSVSQLFSFLVDCSGMILNGFGVVAFFTGVRASSFCIHLSCLVCIQSVVRGVRRKINVTKLTQSLWAHAHHLACNKRNVKKTKVWSLSCL